MTARMQTPIDVPRLAVFLDRDGTLIEERGHICSCSQVAFFPEAVAALRRLQERFLLFIVTNQPGVAEGAMSRDDVERVNAYVVRRLAKEGIVISGVYYCPHKRSDNCECIKPSPYFLRQAAAQYNVALSQSFVVGDHPHDIELARAAGAQGVYVLTGHGTRHITELPDRTTMIARGIREAAEIILTKVSPHMMPGENMTCSRPKETARGFPVHSLRPNPTGDWPHVDPNTYVDPTAQVIGKVRIGPRVFVGPNAIIRADEPAPDGDVLPVEISAESNVQDGVIIHALAGTKVCVGPQTSLAHGCIIHGPCFIGTGCFVGMGAVLFGVQIGDGVFIGPGATVCHVQLPAHSLVPAGITISSSEEALLQRSTTGPAEQAFMQKVVAANLDLAMKYAKNAIAGK